MLHSPEPPDEPRVPRLSFQDELAEIVADSGVWRLALRRAGSRELAEDALQETFYAVARVKDPGRIESLRRFFCRALINEISHQLVDPRPIPLDDPETARGYRQQTVVLFGLAGSRPVEDEAVGRVLADTLLTRFRRARERLEAGVPGRSRDPGRYRSVIVAVAERILHAAVDGHVSRADSNTDLQHAYPDWFGEPGCARDTCYQRLSRARRDVRTLLLTVVSLDELSP
jgi:DNA-directed RNA polymerase specialized sigma24 family protein